MQIRLLAANHSLEFGYARLRPSKFVRSPCVVRADLRGCVFK
jgi:hypothetical protein